jgi:starch synthase
MKIFFIFIGSPLKKDASTTHQLELFSNLEKLTSIFLFLPDIPEKSLNFSNIIRVPRFNFPIIGIVVHQILLFYFLIWQYLKVHPDIIYTRYAEFNVTPVIFSRLFRVPIIIEVNGLSQAESDLASHHDFFTSSSFIHRCERYSFKNASKIIAVTEQIKTAIQKSYGDMDISVVNNGANIDLFKPYEQSKAQVFLQLDRSKKYIGYIGSLRPWQGVEYLLKAAPLVIRNIPDTVLLIVGDGELRNELERLATDLGIVKSCIFIGGVQYEDVPLYINACSVCVVPKKPIASGYSPLKLYEYMACGKTVIATRTNGFEVLEREHAGILINPEDSNEFADAIVYLLNNEKLRIEMGSNGRKYIVDNQSWSMIAKIILGICHQAINH